VRRIEVASEEPQKVTAYHEAGHMVAAWELGLTVIGATIVPNPEEGYAGRAWIPVEDRVRYADWVDENEYLYAHLVTYYAGIATHEILTGIPMSSPEVEVGLETYGSDYYNVSDLILTIAGPDEAKQVEVGENAKRHARNLIRGRRQWKRVSNIADVLLERETLDEGECRQILEQYG
jgi:ATP-dependent Zn protease